ncbi:MAG: hypothetical protein ACR2KJ_03135 [Jatrophihabitans sp.]
MVISASAGRAIGRFDRIDPFRAIPVLARLGLAALLAAAANQRVVTFIQQPGQLTPGSVGPMICDYQGFCTAGAYYPGIYIPGVTTPVTSAVEAQSFLILAVVLLAVVALQPRTVRTQFVARAATLALATAFILAAAQGQAVVLIGLALVFVAPPAWRAARTG